MIPEKINRWVYISSKDNQCLPCTGAAAHHLVRLLDDKLAARLALFIALALGLVIAHVHELRVVVAVCSSGSHPAGVQRKTGKQNAQGANKVYGSSLVTQHEPPRPTLWAA